MTDTLVARSRMAEIESRLGIEPVDELLAKRMELVERVADLRALYGSFGSAESLRKIELSRIKMLLRAQAARDGVKMTDGATDDAAHDHPDYRDFVMQATKDRAEWIKLEAQIEAIDATIQRANVIGRFATAEVRL